MAQEEKNRLADWLLLLRDQLPELRQRLRAWLTSIYQEPRQLLELWNLSAIRYTTYFLVGLILLWGVSWTANAIAPPPPASALPKATSADYHVVCSQETCRHHYVIHRNFGFDQFPVACTQCKKQTGRRAVRCFSNTCRGSWVAPNVQDGVRSCSSCGKSLE